jgi:L-asparaginase II
MPIHTETVTAWLGALGLTTDHLVCGVQTPDHQGTADALREAGAAGGREHNNCSGKHTGFLATAVHLGEDPATYHLAEAQLQRRVLTALTEMGDHEIAPDDFGIDGCGVPNYAMTTRALAQAMARIRKGAIERIYGAMAAESDIIRGGNSFDSLAIGLGGGAFITKTGAEGVHVAALRDRGLGIAIKIEDGARRAADLAIAQLLHACGVLDGEAQVALASYLERPVLNTRGEDVGAVRISDNWAADLARL